MRGNKHMISPTDAEEASDKIQHPFYCKTLSELGIEENFLNILKTMYKNTQPTLDSMVTD